MQLRFFDFATILFQQGFSISLPCKGTVTNADSSVLGRKTQQRFSIPVSWIRCNRSIWCWWTYWNCGHAAQRHFPGHRLPETSLGASWTRRSEESENILVVFYNKSAVRTWTMGCSTLTCTMAAMSCGSMAKGNRRMLKREMEVKAFSAVSKLSLLTPTNTANVTRDTWEGKTTWETKITIVGLLLLASWEALSRHSPEQEHSWRWRWRQTLGRQTSSWPSVLRSWCLQPGFGRMAPMHRASKSGDKQRGEWGRGGGRHCGKYGKGRVGEVKG